MGCSAVRPFRPELALAVARRLVGISEYRELRPHTAAFFVFLAGYKLSEERRFLPEYLGSYNLHYTHAPHISESLRWFDPLARCGDGTPLLNWLYANISYPLAALPRLGLARNLRSPDGRGLLDEIAALVIRRLPAVGWNDSDDFLGEVFYPYIARGKKAENLEALGVPPEEQEKVVVEFCKNVSGNGFFEARRYMTYFEFGR